MGKISNILEGWSKTMGLLKISAEEQALSNARLKVCAECPHAQPSKVLKVINGMFDNVGVLHCTQCGCPVNEKSQVANEDCPLGKWVDIK